MQAESKLHRIMIRILEEIIFALVYIVSGLFITVCMVLISKIQF